MQLTECCCPLLPLALCLLLLLCARARRRATSTRRSAPTRESSRELTCVRVLLCACSVGARLHEHAQVRAHERDIQSGVQPLLRYEYGAVGVLPVQVHLRTRGEGTIMARLAKRYEYGAGRVLTVQVHLCTHGEEQ